MLQIRLNKGSFADGVSMAKSLPVETVTVACPDHLVIADLPVAKGLGSATSASRVKIVGRRSRRQLGERVHFCVRCDFPIAVYGRLSPCEHAYCLDCARSDSICYLCDERIQKIQTIKMMEGIFVCAAPHCLKSFLKKVEFESHIHESHTDLLHPSSRKEELNRSESFSGKQQTQASESSSVRTPTPRPAPPPCHMNPSQPPSDLLQDRARRGSQFREQTPLRPPLMQPRGSSGPSYFGQNNTNLQQLPDLAQESGMRQRPDFPGPQGRIPNFDSLSDKQQQHGGILSDHPSHYPPSVYYQHPNHPGMGPPPPFFSMSPPPFQSDGGAPSPFYGSGGRSDSSAIEIGSTTSEPGSASGFLPGGGGSSDAPPGFDGHPPRPWSAAGPSGSGAPFESAMQAGGGQHMNSMIMDGIYQGDNAGRSSLPPLTPLAVPMMNFNKASTAEQSHQGSSPKGGGVLSSMPPPPPGPPPPHILQQQKHGNFFSGGGEGMN